MAFISYKHSLTKGLKFSYGYQKDLKLELLTVLSFLAFVQLQNQEQYQSAVFHADQPLEKTRRKP